jgi:psp operon transcriptional activator
LAQHFAVNMVKELGREYFPGFSKTAAAALQEYEWPGNVRELKNVVERAVYQSEDAEEPVQSIVFDPFASPFRPPRQTPPPAATAPAAAPSDTAKLVLGETGFKQQVQDFEVKLLQQALRQSRFNQRTAAKLLGLSYDQLRGYLRKYELLSAQD